ncbi:MAG TPA: ATP-binding protein [Anaeromyxobacter sp.]|nr:ATP-binding protein [Anaeromyxobacter sp.]
MPGSGQGIDPAAAVSLRRKLVWLTFFRVLSITVLLGGAAFVSWGSDSGLRATAPLYPLIIATYLCSIAFALGLGRDRALVPVAYGQILLDVGIAAALVAITGYVESVFVFMFSLGIVNGAILLARRGALTALVLAVTAHLGLELLAGPVRPAIPWGALFVQGGAFTVTAVLASYLAEQLRSTGERLAARESDLAVITALHESIVQSVASGLLTLDLGGRITFLNRAAEAMLGLRAVEALGRPADRLFAAFSHDEARGETDFVTGAGEKLRLGYSSFRLIGKGGEATGTVLIFQDLTELRSMEERVARSERLADLGRVAAGLAHELRNPLASMMGALELLHQAPGLAGEDRRLMEIALRESGRLEQLVTQFLAFARPAPPRAVACDLAPLVAETLDVFANDPGAARVALERALAPAPAFCDPAQVRQVLWNLLRNAGQAVRDRPGGSGTIRASCGVDARGPFLAVEDDGPGIPADDRARIFLPFFTTKHDGTGLGLATVHRIVDVQGGAIALEQPSGGGARFVVHLPASAPVAAGAPAGAGAG